MDFLRCSLRVKNFYKTQHALQTVAFNLQVRAAYKARPKVRMSVWEAMELLEKLVDDSDPDVSFTTCPLEFAMRRC